MINYGLRLYEWSWYKCLLKNKLIVIKKYLSKEITYNELENIIETVNEMERIIEIYATMDTDADWGKEAREFLEKYKK